MTLEELYIIIQDRKKSLPNDSYVASLFTDRNDRIIQKVGEEAIEVIIAAKNGKKKYIISETADLLFHICVMLVQFNVTLEDIYDELNKRNKRK